MNSYCLHRMGDGRWYVMRAEKDLRHGRKLVKHRPADKGHSTMQEAMQEMREVTAQLGIDFMSAPAVVDKKAVGG